MYFMLHILKEYFKKGNTGFTRFLKVSMAQEGFRNHFGFSPPLCIFQFFSDGEQMGFCIKNGFYELTLFYVIFLQLLKITSEVLSND